MSGEGFGLDKILSNKLLLKLLFAGVVDSIEDIIFIADCEDRTIYANPAALKRFGYTMQEVLGKKSDFIVSPANPPFMSEMIFEKTLEKGYWKGECLNRTKTGEDFPVFLTTGIIRNEKGEKMALVGVAKDITEIKQTALKLEESNKMLQQTQRELVNSEKLVALGVLSSGLAHEIGNPISSISSLVQLTQRNLKKEKNIFEQAEKMEAQLSGVLKEVERINDILRQMRGVSQTKIFGKENVDVISVVEEAIERTQLSPHYKQIKVITKVESASCEVLASREQLRQVFINIISNAFDAMENGGTLNIKISSTASQVSISFEDTGCGILPEQTKRIFEPFFTTKPNNKGLGLSVSYSIVQGLGGDIIVQSEKAKGTKVKVRLPKTNKKGDYVYE